MDDRLVPAPPHQGPGESLLHPAESARWERRCEPRSAGRRTHAAQSAQGRLAPVRAELLPALSASRSIPGAHRYVRLPRWISLRRPRVRGLMTHLPAVRSVPRSHVAVPRAVDVPDVLRSVRNGAAFAVCYAAASRFADAAVSTRELPPAVFVPGALVLTALLLTPLARWWTIILAALVGHWLATVGQGAALTAVLGSFIIDTACSVLAAALIRNYVDLRSRLSALTSIGTFSIISVAAPLVALLGSAALFQIDAPI